MPGVDRAPTVERRARASNHSDRGSRTTCIPAPNTTYSSRDQIEDAKRGGEPGAVGEILRRENLYSSLITDWRKQRDDGALEGLKAARKGRPPGDPAKAENTRLRKKLAKAQAEVATLKELVDAQGKAAALLRQMSQESSNPRNDS